MHLFTHLIQVFIKRVKNFALKFSAGDRAVSFCHGCLLRCFSIVLHLDMIRNETLIRDNISVLTW